MPAVHDVSRTDWIEPPLGAVRAAVTVALAEDIGPTGDLTSSLLDPGLSAKAMVNPREPGVLAGRLCVDETYAQVDPAVHVRWFARDGDPLEPGNPLAVIEGPMASILTGERTALNFLCHLSGVATATRELVDRTGGDVVVLDTRKTLPGLRALQKAAVRAGGGLNHRASLSESILLKDNHLAELGIAQAVALARQRWPGRRIQVECENQGDVRAALEAGADAVLLDNMTPDEVRRCVSVARKLAGDRCFVEVSGGVTRENVAAYADTGIDAVSSSAITMSARSVDIGIDMEARSARDEVPAND